MEIKLPTGVNLALDILHRNGFKAFVVGGCVRDSIINVAPNDWDICTNALPTQMIEVFKEFHLIETGLKHGTVTVILENEPIEITTFRIDGEYLDNRHPESVHFVEDLKDDLARRDFTINAIAYSEKSGLMDFFGGIADIENKLIKCVGNPDKRFNEDALRILRAVRFSSTLDFNVDETTKSSIFSNKELLKNISVERISVELNKLLTGKNVVKTLDTYREIIAVFIPEIKATFDFQQHNPHHYLPVWEHITQSIGASPLNLNTRLAMLFHDIGKPSCFTLDEYGKGHFHGHQKVSAELSIQILKRLKYDNNTIDKVSLLILEHDNRVPPNRLSIKRFMGKRGYDFLINQLEVRRSDSIAQTPNMIDEKLKVLDEIKLIADDIKKEDECFQLKQLAINGDDLLSIGIPRGKMLGLILQNLLENVILGEIQNEKLLLLEKARAINESLIL